MDVEFALAVRGKSIQNTRKYDRDWSLGKLRKKCFVCNWKDCIELIGIE